jgi:hypothetical protein
MTSCANCGADNPVGVKFCKKCGTPTVAPVTAPVVVPPCVLCGAELAAGAKFCKQCGTPVAGVAPASAFIVSPEKMAEKLTTRMEMQIPVAPIVEAPPELEKPPAQTGLAFEPPPEPVFAVEEPQNIEENTSTESTLPAADDTPFGMPAEPEKSDQKQLKMIVAGVVVVALIAGGLFWWHSAKKAVPAGAATAALPAPIVDSAPAVEQNVPASPTLPDLGKPPAAAPSAPVAAVTPDAPAAPAPSVAAPTAILPEPVEKAPTMAPMRPMAAPSEMQSQPKIAKPAPQADPMAGTIATLLGKADSYTANGQYDKAIATAESVLAIEPGNRAAKSAISKAKARQMDALKSNSSLE